MAGLARWAGFALGLVIVVVTFSSGVGTVCRARVCAHLLHGLAGDRTAVHGRRPDAAL